jgi:hypothetical protein
VAGGGELLLPVSRRAAQILESCSYDADMAAAMVVQEVKTTLSSEALRMVRCPPLPLSGAMWPLTG